MDDRTYQILTSLAERLGTTIEHLWAVLAKQAFVTGVTNVIVLAVVTAVAYYLTRVVQAKTAPRKVLVPHPYNPEAAPHEEMLTEWGEGDKEPAWVGIGAMWIVTAILWGALLTDTAAAIFNPEFWALKQVLGSLR